MKKFNREDPLISIHIPKTGGISFREILIKWFGERLFLHYYNEKDKIMPFKHELASGICIHGHFNSKRNFGVNDYYPQANQFIAFLRDPFEILVSRFFYVKKNEIKGISYREGNQLFLPDDINSYVETEIDNINYHPNILDYFPNSLTNHNYKEIIDDKFVFIGLMEDYQNAVNRLATLLEFPKFELTRENDAERFDKTNIKLRDKFIENHTLEYQVYNYVREIYYNQ